MRAPFPWFGGKSKIVDRVWSALGQPKHYVEPFCGSAAMLLAAPRVSLLEVVNDANGFLANFWRCVKHQPEKVAEWSDYPVSHVDLGARHRWLMDPGRKGELDDELQDPDWPGDPKVAGWWLWGQCAWIGTGWCDWFKDLPKSRDQIPFLSRPGQGVHAKGAMPAISNGGMGVQVRGQMDAAAAGYLTSSGRAAHRWLGELSQRLERVRIIHGDWKRGMNTHYGRNYNGVAAAFIDPPYRGFSSPYGCVDVADEVEAWCAEWGDRVRIVLCGHAGDYELPGWRQEPWSRTTGTYGSTRTKDQECLWYSPQCINSSSDTGLFKESS